MRIETYTIKLELEAVEGRLIVSSNNSKTHRLFNPATPRNMESGNAVLIETPPWNLRRDNDLQDYKYVTDDDIIRDIRDYTSVVPPLSEATIDHITAGTLPNNPKMAELLARIGDITRKDTLLGRISGRSPGEVPRT